MLTKQTTLSTGWWFIRLILLLHLSNNLGQVHTIYLSAKWNPTISCSHCQSVAILLLPINMTFDFNRSICVLWGKKCTVSNNDVQLCISLNSDEHSFVVFFLSICSVAILKLRSFIQSFFFVSLAIHYLSSSLLLLLLFNSIFLNCYSSINVNFSASTPFWWFIHSHMPTCTRLPVYPQ